MERQYARGPVLRKGNMVRPGRKAIIKYRSAFQSAMRKHAKDACSGWYDFFIEVDRTSSAPKWFTTCLKQGKCPTVQLCEWEQSFSSKSS